jgi:hypothetical protein
MSSGASKYNYILKTRQENEMKLNDNSIYTFGWIGSTNDQIRINDGDVVIRLRFSIRSSKPCPAESDTAIIPRNVGCHWTHVTILSRDCFIDENDWYSFFFYFK